MPFPDTTAALDHLRFTLLELKATGDNGFEGLVAGALATLSGLTFRLSKSGSQFGRDAASNPSSVFAIGFESKLYGGNLRLEDLAGKATLASIFQGGKVDVWALGTTAAVGEQTVAELIPALEERGVSLLVLDWTSLPLPPLAVLLTAARQRTVAWFGLHRPDLDEVPLAEALAKIAEDEAFVAQHAELVGQVTAARVGLDALRRAAEAWLGARFADPKLSQLTFGQRITVAQPNTTTVSRSGLVEALQDLVVVDEAVPVCVAVLGDEGAGKTWLVAQWWRSLPDPPILVLIAGRRAELLDPSDALGSLARLLADQDGRRDDETIISWKRRLTRWKGQGAAGALRFVVVADGLNERATMPWADILLGLAVEVQALGGALVVTSRSAFWKRDVEPRLGAVLTARPLVVPDYSDTELATQLARVGRSITQISDKVRVFIRNPRVCAVALELLDRLPPEGLSVELLLMEYWRARLAERGNGLRHTTSDFDKLLRGHARAFLNQPGRPFDRDNWVSHSGAARRLGVAEVANDLTEIEEGRFLTIQGDDLDNYAFRPEALPFALGLLLNDDIKAELNSGTTTAEEALDRVIDPVRAFDQIGEILGAAAILACLDARFPAEGRRALIVAWLGLQNLADEAFEAMRSALLAKPSAFLDVVELPRRAFGDVAREDLLIDLLIEQRDAPAVASGVATRLNQWLGTWSRQGRAPWRGMADHAGRQTRREQEIDGDLAQLSTGEVSVLRSLTHQLPEPPAAHLDQVAADLMAGGPQRPFAPGLAGWAIARTLAQDLDDDPSALEWVVRLNTTDWSETRDAVTAIFSEVTPSSSGPMRTFAARGMRLLGDLASAQHAQALQSLPARAAPSRRDRFHPVDPLDLDAALSSPPEAALAALERIDIEEMWIAMSPTAADHGLEEITPVLARFAPDALAAKLNEVVRQAATRTKLPLRQLGWRLPWLAPILGSEAAKAIRQGIDDVIADPSRAPQTESHIILLQLVGGLMPTLDSQAQIELLFSLPADIPHYYALRRAAKVLPPQALEQLVLAAKDDSGRMARLLFFVARRQQVLAPSIHDLLIEKMFSDKKEEAASAAELIWRAADPALNARVISRLETRNTPTSADPDDAFAVARTVATAIVQQHRPDLVNHVTLRFVDTVVAALGKPALGQLAGLVEGAVARLTKPIAAKPPENVDLFYALSRDGMEASAWVNPVLQNAPQDPMAALGELNDPEGGARRYAEQQKARIQAAKDYRKALTAEGAAGVASAPPIRGLQLIARETPAVTADWLERLLEVSDAREKSNIKNLALAIASAHAHVGTDLAAKVFTAFEGIAPVSNVVIGDARLPFELVMIVRSGDGPALLALRRRLLDEAFSDDVIEGVVLAAEDEGLGEWLQAYVEEGANQAHPARVARALTVASFRSPNDHSRLLLERDWGESFLGRVAQVALARYAVGEQSLAWYKSWKSATTSQELWTRAVLLEEVADRRIVQAVEKDEVVSDLVAVFGEEQAERWRKAAEKQTKARADTLFGQKKPSDDLIERFRSLPAQGIDQP
jgi:hypothetical protein